jgi:hypothetical protein
VKNTVMPMLSRVAGYLTTVETYGGSSYTFPLGTTSWPQYTVADMGDVYLFHGGLLAARWALALPVSYNVNPGTFDMDKTLMSRDTNGDGLLSASEYLPASPFLTLTSAATVTASKTDMSTACAKIVSGIDATLAETSDNHDLIPWHTADSGITRADILLAKDTINSLKASLDAPTTITYTGSEGDPISIKAYLGAWAANPPTDLKTLAPKMEICRYRWSMGMPYDYYKVVMDGGYTDKTFKGMFPDGVPNSMLYEPRKQFATTVHTGDVVNVSTYPGRNARNVSTDYANFTVTFNTYPPAKFGVMLQRIVAGVARNERISALQSWDGMEYQFYPLDGLWPNSTYQLVITNEVSNPTHTNAIPFSTGADVP